MVEGKSKKAAALEAGYSEATAWHPKQTIDSSPAVQRLFTELLEKAGATDELLAKRIVDGLGAFDTKFATFEGDITDSQEVIAFSERREMVELVLKVKGYLVDKHEIKGKLTLEDLLDGTHE